MKDQYGNDVLETINGENRNIGVRIEAAEELAQYLIDGGAVPDITSTDANGTSWTVSPSLSASTQQMMVDDGHAEIASALNVALAYGDLTGLEGIGFKPRTVAEPGSVSTGTLRTEDLLPRFLSVLDSLREARSLAPDADPAKHGREDDDLGAIEGRLERGGEDYLGSEEANWDLERVMEMLEEFAPAGHSFGAHPGDGADFGFWPDELEFEPDDDDKDRGTGPNRYPII